MSWSEEYNTIIILILAYWIKLVRVIRQRKTPFSPFKNGFDYFHFSFLTKEQRISVTVQTHILLSLVLLVRESPYGIYFCCYNTMYYMHCTCSHRVHCIVMFVQIGAPNKNLVCLLLKYWSIRYLIKLNSVFISNIAYGLDLFTEHWFLLCSYQFCLGSVFLLYWICFFQSFL